MKEGKPVLGISFFGVTPGFSQKHLSRNQAEMTAALNECSHIFTLGQFTINIPAGGTLYVFGGQSTQHGQIRFIGQLRHAIEYGGNRGGGYGGAGIWLSNSWISGERAADLLDQMIGFLRAHLVDDNERFIKTFDQIDWHDAYDFLDLLEDRNSTIVDAGLYNEPIQQPLKILIKEPFHSKNAESRRDVLVKIIQCIGKSLESIHDRIIYLSFDSNVIDATMQLGRVHSMTFDEFFKSRTHWATSSGKTSSQSTPNRGQYTENATARTNFGDWEPETSRYQTSAFEPSHPSQRESRYPFGDPSSAMEGRSTPLDRQRYTGMGFKITALGNLEYYFKLMTLYCFIAVNLAILAVILLYYFNHSKTEDPSGTFAGMRKSGDGQSAEVGESPSNSALEKAQSARGGSDNAASSGSVKDSDGTAPSKPNADLPCPRDLRNNKIANLEQMLVEAQNFLTSNRNLEGRIEKSLRNNDTKLSLSRDEIEIALKVIQRERFFARCLEQLQR